MILTKGGLEETKQLILDACKEVSTVHEIAGRAGLSYTSVRAYMEGPLADKVIRFSDEKPWLYVAMDGSWTKEEVQRRASELRQKRVVKEHTVPLLPQGPLSFLSEYQRYTPPVGRKVEERHATWIGRREGAHIGNGSCALMEMA